MATINQISSSEGFVFGLGADNKVYLWNKEINDWVLWTNDSSKKREPNTPRPNISARSRTE